MLLEETRDHSRTSEGVENSQSVLTKPLSHPFQSLIKSVQQVALVSDVRDELVLEESFILRNWLGRCLRFPKSQI